jgi:hypothetical protein
VLLAVHMHASRKDYIFGNGWLLRTEIICGGRPGHIYALFTHVVSTFQDLRQKVLNFSAEEI